MPRRVAQVAISLLALLAVSADPKTPEPADEAYTRTIRKRADGIIAALNVKDPKKVDALRDVITAHYRALRDWHDAHDAELKELGRKPATETAQRVEAIKAPLKKLHDEYLSRLSEMLTAEQVETVKDQMTYNVVRVTYDGYCQMLPDLTDEQKKKVLETLKEGREEAMDGGSSEEKHAIFGRYKGRVNNYLSKQGYDLKKASKEWNERRRKARDAKDSQPSKAN